MKSFLTSATVKDADTAIAAVVYLVVAKHRVALRLYPDAGHRVVKDLVVLNDAKAAVVHKDSSVLSAPDLIAPYQRIAASSVKTATHYFILTLHIYTGLLHYLHVTIHSKGEGGS